MKSGSSNLIGLCMASVSKLTDEKAACILLIGLQISNLLSQTKSQLFSHKDNFPLHFNQYFLIWKQVISLLTKDRDYWIRISEHLLYKISIRPDKNSHVSGYLTDQFFGTDPKFFNSNIRSTKGIFRKK